MGKTPPREEKEADGSLRKKAPRVDDAVLATDPVASAPIPMGKTPSKGEEAEESPWKKALWLDAPPSLGQRVAEVNPDKMEMTSKVQAESHPSGCRLSDAQGYAIRGITKIGNTCYMSAELQCLGRMLALDHPKGPLAEVLKELFVEASAAGDVLDSIKVLTWQPTKNAASPQPSGSPRSQKREIPLQLLPANVQRNLEKMQTVSESARVIGSEVLVERTHKPFEVDSIQAQRISQSKDVVQSPLQIQEGKSVDSLTEGSLLIGEFLSLFCEGEVVCCPNFAKDHEEPSASQSKNVEQIVGNGNEDDVGDIVKTLRFITLPPVLTLHLNRTSYPNGTSMVENMVDNTVGIKISGHVKFMEYLDVKPFMDTSSVNEGTCYRLPGVVEHIGKGSLKEKDGHYIVYDRARRLGNQQESSRYQKRKIAVQLFPADVQRILEKMQTVFGSGYSRVIGSEVLVEKTHKPLEVDSSQAQCISQSKEVVQSPLLIQVGKSVDSMTISLFSEDKVQSRCPNCTKDHEPSASQSKNGEQIVGSVNADDVGDTTKIYHFTMLPPVLTLHLTRTAHPDVQPFKDPRSFVTVGIQVCCPQSPLTVQHSSKSHERGFCALSLLISDGIHPGLYGFFPHSRRTWFKNEMEIDISDVLYSDSEWFLIREEKIISFWHVSLEQKWYITETEDIIHQGYFSGNPPFDCTVILASQDIPLEPEPESEPELLGKEAEVTTSLWLGSIKLDVEWQKEEVKCSYKDRGMHSIILFQKMILWLTDDGSLCSVEKNSEGIQVSIKRGACNSITMNFSLVQDSKKLYIVKSGGFLPYELPRIYEVISGSETSILETTLPGKDIFVVHNIGGFILQSNQDDCRIFTGFMLPDVECGMFSYKSNRHEKILCCQSGLHLMCNTVWARHRTVAQL